MQTMESSSIKSIININWSIIEVFIGILAFTIISFISGYTRTGIMGAFTVLNLSIYLWTFTELLIVISASSMLINKTTKPENKLYLYFALFIVYVISLIAASITITMIYLIMYGVVALYDYLFKSVIRILDGGLVPRSRRRLFK